jgi:hypothetical protein
MKQITVVGQIQIDVVREGEVTNFIVTDFVAPGVPSEVIVVPIPNKDAEAIGKKLSAPSLQIAGADSVQGIR